MSYITTGGGGMGNQLKKFISALRLKSSSKAHLSYYTKIFKDKSLCVLDPGARYTELNTWRIMVLPSDTDIPDGFCKYATADKGFHFCDANGRNVDHEYLRIPVSFRQKIILLIPDYNLVIWLIIKLKNSWINTEVIVQYIFVVLMPITLLVINLQHMHPNVMQIGSVLVDSCVSIISIIYQTQRY